MGQNTQQAPQYGGMQGKQSKQQPGQYSGGNQLLGGGANGGQASGGWVGNGLSVNGPQGEGQPGQKWEGWTTGNSTGGQWVDDQNYDPNDPRNKPGYLDQMTKQLQGTLQQQGGQNGTTTSAPGGSIPLMKGEESYTPYKGGDPSRQYQPID